MAPAASFIKALFKQTIDKGKSFLLSVPLKLKILGLALGLILFFGAVTIYNVQKALKENMDDFLKEESRFIAAGLSYQVYDYLLINDLYGLTQMLRDMVQSRPDLRYIFVRNSTGQVIAHTFEGGFPADLLMSPAGIPSSSSELRLLHTNEGKIWEASAGISNGSEGVVLVAVRGDRLQRQIEGITGALARTTLLVAAFGMLLSLGLTWLITRPVGRLLKATRAVQDGDYSVRLIPAETKDELGKLMEGFNAMVLSLASADNARLEKEYLQRDFLHRVMAGQEGERKRIARELHDQTGQALASVMVDLKMLENAKNESDTSQSIGRLRKAITEEMAAIHDLAVALRPSVLDDLGLVPAVEMLVRSFIGRQGIMVELTVIGFAEKRADACTETCIYRVVQEALANVARHAQATEVSVLLEWRGDKIRGVIEDNGIGFDPDMVDAKTSLGVLGMQERTQLLNGTFRIESSPGEGAMLVFEMSARAGICHE